MCRCRNKEEEEEENENETMETRLKRLSREGQRRVQNNVSCCDSRCDPTAVFDALNRGRYSCETSPTSCRLCSKTQEEKMMKDHGTVSAIEYAVKSLSRTIVVLGPHKGVRTALSVFLAKT